MNLNDIQNDVLFSLQQSEMVNFGASPNWSQATNPGLTQAALNFQINRSYMRVIQDLSDVQLALYRWVFASIAQVSDYPLPPFAPPNSTLWGASFWGSAQLGAGAPVQPGVWGQGQWGQMEWGTLTGPPNIQRVTRVIYSPQGQPWSQDFEGGVRLVSWQELQRYNAFGYLKPFCFGIIPDFCAISPARDMISFFPGSADSNDAIGIEYIPKLTPNTAWPPLIQPTDSPQLPDETHDLIVQWAAYLCCPKLNMFGRMADFKAMYHGLPQERGMGGELARVRDQLGQRSTGDTMRIRDAQEGIGLSYPMIGVLIP